MKRPVKIYKAYSGYGKHPLTDSEVLVRISQNRKKWQCRPVSKLYVRKSVDRGHHYMKTYLLKALMESGKSYDEACSIADNLK